MQPKMKVNTRQDQLAELEEHIKNCAQCQNSPYNPCDIGKAIIGEVIESAKEIRRSRTMHFIPKITASISGR